MKKSNKILLGGFLTVILIITGIHIALFAKYKNGNYTIYPRQEEIIDSSRLEFQGIKTVRISNVFSATILLADRAQMKKINEHIIRIEQKGDSLIITGHFNNDAQAENRFPINITLPSNA